MLIGLVLGLAIYNAVLLDFPLPQALYRKLLGQGCTLRDLSDMDPTLGRSLSFLLAYDGRLLLPGTLVEVFLDLKFAWLLYFHLLLKLTVIPTLADKAMQE